MSTTGLAESERSASFVGGFVTTVVGADPRAAVTVVVALSGFGCVRTIVVGLGGANGAAATRSFAVEFEAALSAG